MPNTDIATQASSADGPTPGRFSRMVAGVTGRRMKWVVIGVWLLAVLATGPFQALLEERSTNSSTSFLPTGADSTEVAQILSDGKTFANGEEIPAIVVFQGESGAALSDDAKARIGSFVQRVEADADKLPTFTGVRSPLQPGAAQQGLASRDGTTMAAFVTLDDPESEQIDEAVKHLREIADEIEGDGLDVYVSGPAGLAADASQVFSGIDGKLLIGTSTLVLVLLLLIYRSPLIALVPLIAVIGATSVARVLLAVLIEPLGLTVSAQVSGIMLILLFGAGTDYCLLIVARFREELRRFEDPHDAMREAVRHTTPAIVSSAGTVIAAMAVLLLADLRSTSSLGPAAIVGISIAALAGLTLLPALILAFGRRSFWPFIPRYGSEPTSRINLWGRVGSAISRRPWQWLITVSLLLVVAAGGLLPYENQRTSDIDIFLDRPESTQGLAALGRALPAGELAQGTVIVTGSAATIEQAAGAVARRLQQREGIAQAFPAGSGTKGDLEVRRITFAFEGNPYRDAAIDDIEPMRRDLRNAVREFDGARTLVGGPTAETADTQRTNRRDLRIIVPGVLLSIFVILALLLRALIAPIHLILSVVLSFAATMGLCYGIFLAWLNDPGIDPGTITYIFLFTVALGVDYSIFLVTRIREETARLGTRAGTMEALRATGGVITSAGIILAGTFMILAVLPLLFMRQLGVAVALGVLLDTILVRATIVPALMYILGDRNWWPSKASRSDKAAAS
jgi:RND superfamily putative drug exporter